MLTAVTLPRTALLLLGGAVADRFGARRVVIAGDAVLLVATSLLALAAWRLGTPTWLLMTVAAVLGTVGAFSLPAAGAMPRRLVAREQLPRALAVQQAGRQAASLLGAPLGAVAVAATGLAGVALVDALTFAAVIAAVARVRPGAADGGPAPAGSLMAGMAEGARLAVRDPLLRAALLLTGAAAGGLLPVVSLLGPLLAREQGWGARGAGMVAGGQSLGMVVVALLVARRGPLPRIGVGAALGLCVAAAGVAALAAPAALAAAGVAVAGVAAAGVAAAGCAGVVIGVGSGMFASHVGPLVLAGAPDSHTARVQALLTLTQSLALVVANNALGRLADAAGASVAVSVCAAVVCCAGLAGLKSGALRGSRAEG